VEIHVARQQHDFVVFQRRFMQVSPWMSLFGDELAAKRQ
jgi:hypothetical protein